MRASAHSYASATVNHQFPPTKLASGARLPADKWRPTRGRLNSQRLVQQLVWVLIALLLLLFLATSYLFWAKLESAWPILR